MRRPFDPGRVLALASIVLSMAAISGRAAEDAAVAALGKEVAGKGWIVFAAHPAEIDGGRIIDSHDEREQLDLYLARPDGSGLRDITRTNESHEFGGRFSPDGKTLLYRRASKEAAINHDRWGTTGEVVLADADGSHPVVQGKPGEYPWASPGPDMKQIACLYKDEGTIRIFDLASKKLAREMPSQGIFQQMFWSPDGKRLVGTANIAGRQWNIVSIDLATQKATLLTRALNCTPDWFQGDPERVIYSNRNPALFPGQYKDYGLTMLMQATADGKSRKLIYGNAWRHCYFGCTSPDDKYVIFSDDAEDGLLAGEMRVLRLADAPIIPPSLKTLKLLYPDSKEGPVFSLRRSGGAALRGFEPHWTYADVGGRP
jgi:hypothetical protein